MARTAKRPVRKHPRSHGKLVKKTRRRRVTKNVTARTRGRRNVSRR